MAEGDQIAALFRRLNSGDARYRKHIAFFVATGLDQLQRFRRHGDIGFRAGCALGNRLAAHVHHMGFALGIQVAELIRLVAHEVSSSRIMCSYMELRRSRSSAFTHSSTW